MSKFFVLNRKKISSITFTIIFLLPFFRYYDIPVVSVSIETLLILVLFVLCCFLKTISKQNNDHPRLKKSRISFALFFLWLCIITLIFELGTNINIYNNASEYSVMTYVIMIPTAYIIFSLLDSRWDVSNVFLLYTKLVNIVLVIYAIQWVLNLLGVVLSFKIPFLPYNRSWSYLNNIVFGMNNRPTSLFSEPAHLAEYLLPYLALCLFGDVYKKKYTKSIIITLVILSTASGNGIIGTLVLWAAYIIVFARINLAHRIILVCGGVVICLGIYHFLLSIPVYSHIFGELFVNSTGKYSGTKADYRIYRGFDYFCQLPLGTKITGVGYQHMHAFANVYGLVSKFDSSNNAFEFFSTITQVLLYSGIVGGSLFFLHIYNLWKEKNIMAKGVLVMCLAIWFSSQMLFANSHIMYIALIVAALLNDSKEDMGH